MMVTKPLVLPDSVPTRQLLVDSLLDALAEIRGCSIGELEVEMLQNGGDLEMESPEAVAVISKVERKYGGRCLAKVEDLEPEVLTSVGALAELIHFRWPLDVAEEGGNE